MYREVLVPVDNSQCSDWAVGRAIELCSKSGGRITGNHVYAARLHDVRFRQLETGLPAQFQTPQEIKRQRKVHDKLIEKGLQLISDSFLDQVETQCADASIPLRRQLLEGINFEEIINEVNRGEGQLPSLIDQLVMDLARALSTTLKKNIRPACGGAPKAKSGSAGCRSSFAEWSRRFTASGPSSEESRKSLRR